jgi:hypothetical protein
MDTYKIEDGYLRKDAKNFTVLTKNHDLEVQNFFDSAIDPDKQS